MRVATIDIGTNSVLLLIAEPSGGDLVPVVERATITRLGRGVDRTRALDPDAARDTLACLEAYAAEIRDASAARVDVVGTSAMRDARGGDDFRERARSILGVAPRVISGDEEAALTFGGALVGLGALGSREDDRDALVFDLGGGSTEIIRGRAGVLSRARSLDIGSVRLTERHLASDPPLASELDAARADTRRALGELEAGYVDLAERSPRVVGVAGTITTLAAHVLGVAPYDAARVHGARLDARAITAASAELARMPLAARKALPAIDPRRADVIVAGALIVEEILAWAGADELVVSDRGVRWGLAKRLAALAPD